MKEGWDIQRWIKIGGVSMATVVWAFLFYTNYLNASVVAFGDIANHLADLKLVFWKYMGGAAALAGIWAVFLFPKAHQAAHPPETERLRARGH